MGKQKMTPLEWAYKHAGYLKAKKDELNKMEVHEDIERYLERWGASNFQAGHWTILKHISLAYCLTPFGVILKSKGIKDTAYLDVFCGAGISPLKADEKSTLEWVVGSPIISTRMTNYPFNKYYFNDNNKRSVQLAKGILDEWNRISPEKRVYEITQDDANAAVCRLLPEIKDKYVFAFIDPAGFQWNWISMESLFEIKMFDILMNFQTRMVDRVNLDIIKSYFGPCADEVLNLDDCDEKLNAYINQIEEKGLSVTPIRIGKDKTNQYYYHMLHISRLDTYKGIINDIKKRIETFDGKSIETIWRDLHGHVKQKSLPIEI